MSTGGSEINIFNTNTFSSRSIQEDMRYKSFDYIRKSMDFPQSIYRSSIFNEQMVWSIEDFDYVGSIISGLSDLGKKKISLNKDLRLPKNNLLGQSITGIGKDAFRNLDIRKLTIPELDRDEKYYIGTCAFYGNKLRSLNLPQGVVEIEANAFQKNLLEKLIIPESIYKIGNSAFRANRISELRFEENLIPIHIDNFAFADNKIVSVNFPRNVIKTLAYVFMNNIGKEAISGKNSYGRVHIYTSNPSHLEEGQYIRESEYQKIILKEPLKWEIEDFIIEGTSVKGFSSLGLLKFADNKDLIIPDKNGHGDKITDIGESAFKVSSKEIIFNNDLVYVPNGIKKLTIPKSVKSIGRDAFRYNNINELSLPKGLKIIGETAFAGNKIEVLELSNSIKEIGEGAFSLNSLKEITIPGSIKNISDGAFGRNTDLVKVNIEEGVNAVGNYAFVGAPIKQLVLPSSIREVGERAFAYHKMEFLEIPGTVNTIKNSAFRGNPKSRKLKKIVLNEGIKNIHKWAFKDNLLKEVDLPESLRLFHESVFSDNGHSNRFVRVKIYTNDGRMEKYKSKYQEVLIINTEKC